MKKQTLKQKILILLSKEHLLSAPEMLKILESKGDEYNKTSVYRALDQLMANDVLCKQYLGKSEALYELRDHHHTHLICKECGKIDTTECAYAKPKSMKGFVAEHHHVTVLGVCGDCR